ncbi:DUF3137 domain-containing protein [Nitratireductor kimnyeongensis]|uniref:DUF3137 domain-containing protein n=1 Tax=Nitratireductor kimnyeongensis TaxID=430679 RepID=A0ABW0TBS5_9HYPH|nr:DUF3137 domain-containing protein [Nitratireductor kimnyeongensis]QZZ36897.1 DUF3137 domain-containing protein [Nitratireductor kimnyeongensis]
MTATDQDFNSYYVSEIEPALARANRRRTIRMRIVVGLAALGTIGFCAIAALALVGMTNHPGALAAFALGFGGLLGAGVLYQGLTNEYKRVLTGGVCSYLGFDYKLGGFDFPLARFHPLLPRFTGAKLEDRIRGRVGDVDFELCEGKLSRKDAKWRTIMLAYSFSKPFKGETCVVADTDWIGNAIERLRQAGERVRLESSQFEERFEVFSTDQLEARYLLTPRFMEQILELTQRFNNKRGVALAFHESQLLIAIRIGSMARRFEIGNVFGEVRDGKERAYKILTELNLVTDIVSVLGLAGSRPAEAIQGKGVAG